MEVANAIVTARKPSLNLLCERGMLRMKYHVFFVPYMRVAKCRLYRRSRVLLATAAERTLHYFLKYVYVSVVLNWSPAEPQGSLN
jgi:hypothetical protein